MSVLAPDVDAQHRSARPARVDPAPPDGPVAPRHRALRRVAGVALNLLLALALLSFLALAVGPHLFGYRTSTMLTASMAPSIEAGDVVVTVPKPAVELTVGDVISYHIPVEDHRVETHRVTEVSITADGRVAFRSRGDANENVDPWTAVVAGDSVWEVRAVVPEVGHAIRALRAPVVRNGLLWAALAATLLLGLRRIWGGSDHAENPDAAEEA